MKSKSRGLFPGPRSRPRRTFNGAAGNSSSNNRPPPSGDGYKDGMLGWRESRQAGGQSEMQKLAGRPLQLGPSPGSGGQGGLAFDASAAAAMTDKGRPAGKPR